MDAHGNGLEHAFALTKRELFAAMMAQGSLANEADMAVVAKEARNAPEMHRRIALASVMLADALLAELAK